ISKTMIRGFYNEYIMKIADPPYLLKQMPLPIRMKHMVKQPNKHDKPGRHSNKYHYFRNHSEKGQVQRFRQLIGACCIHSKRKDHPPVLRIIVQWITTNHMPPNPKY